MTSKFNICKECIGCCPENCQSCVYAFCEKEVDYALVHYKYERMLSFICTDRECEEERIFYKWFKAYFGLNNSYNRA